MAWAQVASRPLAALSSVLSSSFIKMKKFTFSLVRAVNMLASNQWGFRMTRVPHLQQNYLKPQKFTSSRTFISKMVLGEVAVEALYFWYDIFKFFSTNWIVKVNIFS